MKIRNYKILVVDDTEATRYAISRTLLKQGFQVVEAKSGAEALKFAVSEKPDLITLDIHLKDMLGFEVCQKIKFDPETSMIPVLLLSASFVSSEDRVFGLEGGADNYLTHPVEPPVLLATIGSLLRNRQLTEDLRQSMEEANVANHAKSRFLSNMSHEIRTPLGVILGFTDLALDTTTSPELRKEYLLTIKRNAENLTKLIGQILDLSKIEAGRIDIEQISFNLRDFVADIIASLKVRAVEKNVGLECSIPIDLPLFIKSDSTRVRQILTNLIGNAIKFTEHGSVRVECSQSISSAGKLTIQFLIRDSGTGIALENQKRIFEPFTQADSSTTRKFGGTGLGLSLSKKLAKSLGGDVTLHSSELGKGSVFCFTFRAEESPSLTREVMSESEIDAQTRDVLKGRKILLVEDSLDNQILFQMYLQHMGATTVTAGNGKEAVEKALETDFDAILMDLQMPVMDGYSATKILRERDRTTRIIALTANAMKEERTRALSMGFDEYLVKPLSIVELMRSLRPA